MNRTRPSSSTAHRIHPAMLSLISGILLTLSFPKASLGFLAWFAVVPLLCAIQRAQTRRAAVFYSFITGINFFAFSLHWLTFVVAFGWVFVACLETSFFLLFGWAAFEARKIKQPMLRALWIGVVWAAVEVMRAEVPVFGFGWNLLAYSQAPYSWMVQSASVMGAFGLSFMIGCVNGLIAEMMFLYSSGPDESGNRKNLLLRLIFPAVLIVSMIAGYGYWAVHQPQPVNGELRIALIQGNIPQDVKWQPMAKQQVLDVHSKLTQIAGFDKPDLVIWPEAAFPGYFNRDHDAAQIYNLAKEIDAPILLGAPHLETVEIAYNSAYLIGRDGTDQGRYDKVHLVPFGEYVPLKPIFGWLEPLARSLGVSDFTEGTELKTFRMMNGELTFAVLICFEDIFPQLARNFADQGARFLAVITNDAWFGPTSAPYQHLEASQFRAVENGIPVVRAANTGVSAFISSRGKVLDRVRDRQGNDIFVIGHKTLALPLDREDTIFRKGGWGTGYLLLALFVIILPILNFKKTS